MDYRSYMMDNVFPNMVSLAQLKFPYLHPEIKIAHPTAIIMEEAMKKRECVLDKLKSKIAREIMETEFPDIDEDEVEYKTAMDLETNIAEYIEINIGNNNYLPMARVIGLMRESNFDYNDYSTLGRKEKIGAEYW